MKTPSALTLTALVMIITAGLAQGWFTHRWLPNTSVASAVERIERVPFRVGEWVGEDVALSELEQQVGGIAGYVQRIYRNEQTGAEVSLLLVTGESGPIAVHPPTACFSGRGYHVQGHQQTWQMETPTVSHTDIAFHQADFANSAIDDPAWIRVYWGWSTDGRWQAADNPRVTWAGQPFLYKLYVSERWVPQTDQADTGAGRSFLSDLLPILTPALDLPSADSSEQEL